VASIEEKSSEFSITAYVLVGLSWPAIITMAILIKIKTFCSPANKFKDEE
jgi:hypothetical protein